MRLDEAVARLERLALVTDSDRAIAYAWLTGPYAFGRRRPVDLTAIETLARLLAAARVSGAAEVLVPADG